MLDRLENDDDVVLRFPGFSFPMTLTSYNKLITNWLESILNKEGGK